MRDYKDKWIDENGKEVISYSGFSQVYSDEESRRLTRAYNPDTCFEFVSCSFGKTEIECAAANILKISKLYGEFVGIEKNELSNFLKEMEGDYSGLFLEEGFLRLKKVKGVEVLFSTEKLLENQGVCRRDEI